MFIGREKEFEWLEKAYSSSQMEFIPVYGRRRVGKSELILNFIKDKPSLYFLGKKAMAQFQIREFLEVAAETFGEPLFATANVVDWKAALELVINSRKPSGRKLVLVFDEFQWTAEASPELPSILQEMLDREWKRRADILLILCGSYLGFMEREVLGEKSPIFGRRTGQILLRPFSYRDASLFHRSWSYSDCAMAYFICGGIPLYLRFFDERYSIAGNIEKTLLDEYAPLFREPDFLLREELRELPKYYGILMCLSSGSHTSREIAALAGIDERKIYYYIQSLVDLGYVSRRFPLSAKRPAQKDVHFILDDPLLSFWFRFVYPHTAYITKVGPKEALRVVVRPKLASYFGVCFETLCREALAFLYQREGVSSPFEIGQYWDRTSQIDVVGYRRGEGIDIGECRWGRAGSLKSLVEEVRQKMRSYPNSEGLSLKGRIFVKSRPKQKITDKDIFVHTLEDMYRV